MGTHLKFKSTDVSGISIPPESLHYLPCSIDHTGNAEVSKFFEPYISKSNSKEMQASFQGHPLEGSVLELPEGYTGILMKERKCDNENSSKEHMEVARFKSITYWNWDRTPSSNDPLQKAMKWLQYSKIVNGAD